MELIGRFKNITDGIIILIKIDLISFMLAPIAKNPISAINTVNSTKNIDLFKIDILKL